MPRFEYACKECNVSWEIEEAIGKAPKTNSCPQCDEQVPRYYGNQIPAISFGDNGCGNYGKTKGARDFHTVKQRYKKFEEKGYDKTSADKFLRRSIRETGERLLDDRHYKAMNFNYENLARDGIVKKLSDEETSKKIKRCDKLTQDAYNKANKQGYDLDITKNPKQS